MTSMQPIARMWAGMHTHPHLESKLVPGSIHASWHPAARSYPSHMCVCAYPIHLHPNHIDNKHSYSPSQLPITLIMNSSLTIASSHRSILTICCRSNDISGNMAGSQSLPSNNWFCCGYGTSSHSIKHPTLRSNKISSILYHQLLYHQRALYFHIIYTCRHVGLSFYRLRIYSAPSQESCQCYCH